MNHPLDKHQLQAYLAESISDLCASFRKTERISREIIDLTRENKGLANALISNKMMTVPLRMLESGDTIYGLTSKLEGLVNSNMLSQAKNPVFAMLLVTPANDSQRWMAFVDGFPIAYRSIGDHNSATNKRQLEDPRWSLAPILLDHVLKMQDMKALDVMTQISKNINAQFEKTLSDIKQIVKKVNLNQQEPAEEDLTDLTQAQELIKKFQLGALAKKTIADMTPSKKIGSPPT